ncbi:MAG TPA: 50S ribosomal protein L25/general stress protein Ctc [Rhizobiales bacterium]|nr:50S ribosomal protein L25 [bacterium BMS3Bbin10]HDO53001.1 50S ribosomal protein L25/general stress protein Ctc [Hyphomicrobiales bacterium]
MAEISQIKAAMRDQTGKGAARAARREGRIPAIIYGDNTDPQTVSVDDKELRLLVRTGQFLNTIFMLDVEGEQTRVIPREFQLHPVRDVPLHVDFMRLGKGAKVTVEVPMQFLNEEESPGLKRGGVLNIVRHTIELRCLAEAIPERLDADLTGLDIGDSLHVSSIKFPEGVELTIADRDFTIVNVVGRMAEIVDEVEEEEDLEGEELEEGEEGAEGEGEEGGEAGGKSEAGKE